MKSGKKIFWGLFFLAAAVLLVAGNFWNLPVLDVLVLLVLAIILVEGIMHRNFALIMFPAAIAIILNSERLGIGEISAWSVLAAALLGSIGLSVLFPKKGRLYAKNINLVKDKFNFSGNNRSFEEVVQDETEGERVRLENAFGNTVKYVTSMALGDVRIENVFGNMTVYFNGAELKDHAAYARMESCFGNTVLYLPASWNVVLHGQTVFGSIKEKGKCDPGSKDVLEIKAEAVFGTLEIRYI